MMHVRRWLKRISLAFVLVVVCAAIGGASYQSIATRQDLAAHPPPGRLVDIGGHRLHIWCTGSGAPTVILDSGLGGSFVDWGYVQPDVSRFTTVCSYDRAGMGYSDPGPFPRTAEQIASELTSLLARAAIPGPVVLAGASLAGLHVRVLASTHPEKVAGLLLVDASHETQRAEIPGLAKFVPLLSTLGFFRVAEVSFGQPPSSLAPHVRRAAAVTGLRTSSYRAAASELLNITDSQAQVKASRRKLDVPVIVLTAGRNSDPEWQQMQRDQVILSDRGCQIIAAGAHHVIPLSQPATVVNAIRAITQAGSGPTTTNLCQARS
jgi:pimeloyl-ACP methyl ester carboxylesterase